MRQCDGPCHGMRWMEYNMLLMGQNRLTIEFNAAHRIERETHDYFQ